MNEQLLRQALDALIDYESVWVYIRESHGDLYGIRGDRAESRGSLAIADLKVALAQSEASLAKYVAYKEQKSIAALNSLSIKFIGDKHD